jgi:DNA polymerase-3 subunit epsilon
MGKILWLDVETTGMDPVVNDIIQLACLVEIDGEVEETLEIRCRPEEGGVIDQSTLELRGLTVDEIMAYPPLFEGLNTFRKMLGKYVDKYNKQDKFIVAGYFVRFDTDFLRASFNKVGDKYYGSWFYSLSLDVASFVAQGVCYGKISSLLPNFKLSTVCQSFDIDITAHDALSDIEATMTLYSMLNA